MRLITTEPIYLSKRACGALLDSRDLPQSKRTQPIDNRTKHQLVVTYRELNKSKMSKTKYHFHPQNSHFYCIFIYANIGLHSSRLVVKIKRPITSILRHSVNKAL